MEPIKEIARILRLPKKGDVGTLDELLGKPVADALAQLGIASRHPEHDHTRTVRDDRQFILNEVFDIPPNLWTNVQNAVVSVNPKWHYLAFTCAEAWSFGDEFGFPPHLRWGYAIEAEKGVGERAKPVFRTLLKERIPDGEKRLQILPDCPLAGFVNKKAPRTPGTWLWFLGRRIPVEELEVSWLLERVLEVAVRDITDIHKALAK